MIDPVRQLPLELSHTSVFHSDDLVITESNRSAFELIEQWPQWLLPISILVGPAGSGKTHFTHVWAQATGALPVNLKQLDKSLSNTAQNIPLYIEDIDNDELNETALFHLINGVKEAHALSPQATLLITARTLPTQWNVQLKDLSSRLKSVALAEIEQADDELLMAVAYKLFSDRQIIVDPNMIQFLISRVERSLYGLNQAIKQIDILTLQRKSKVNKAIITEALNNLSG